MVLLGSGGGGLGGGLSGGGGDYSAYETSASYQYGRFDASALHIAHALRATELHKAYNKGREKPIDYYLVSCDTTCKQMMSGISYFFFKLRVDLCAS